MNRAQISMKLIKGCHNYHAQLFIIYFKFSLRGMTHEFYYNVARKFFKDCHKRQKKLRRQNVSKVDCVSISFRLVYQPLQMKSTDKKHPNTHRTFNQYVYDCYLSCQEKLLNEFIACY